MMAMETELGIHDRDAEIASLRAENERLRAVLTALIKSAKPCPSCHPENECYVFSMVALAEASRAIQE